MTLQTPVQTRSKLPDVGTTIFTVMSALAADKNAVNLGQGFPDFDCDPRIVDAVTHAMRTGHNHPNDKVILLQKLFYHRLQ